MISKYADIFCWKNVSSFCKATHIFSAKATHIFSAKNIRILYIESAITVNEMTLIELVKVTTLWTTGPCFPHPKILSYVITSSMWSRSRKSCRQKKLVNIEQSQALHRFDNYIGNTLTWKHQNTNVYWPLRHKQNAEISMLNMGLPYYVPVSIALVYKTNVQVEIYCKCFQIYFRLYIWILAKARDVRLLYFYTVICL